MNLVQDFKNIYMNKHLILMRLFKNVKFIKMQGNSGSIVHSLYVQIQNFRPYKHLNDVYLCSWKECAAVSFYPICFSTLVL